MSRRGVVAAVDVGGTSIKGLRVDARGRTTGAIERPTPVAGGPDAVVDAVRDVVTALTADTVTGSPDVVAVGIAAPGEVEPDVARYSANLGWRDVPAAALAGTVDVPVVLDHDVRCAALAERTIGVTRDVADACVVVIGTGIASVTVTGGVPARGARGLAGELGHVPVRPGGEPCACGQRGCLETYASAGAVARRYAARTGRVLAAHDVVAALGHDADAAAVWDDAVAALATACVTVTMLEDPAVIALAGGLSGAGEALTVPLRARVSAGLAWRPAPRIEVSPLGGRAGRYGAALRAWQATGTAVDTAAWAAR